MIQTAKAILARGDIVLIFAEGTRIRPGALGRPKRGIGRLALETGVPGGAGRGDRHRGESGAAGASARTRSACGPGARCAFPQVENPSPQLAGAVTDRIWPCVMLQWEWLGGLAPVRRVAVIGAGA